MSNAINYVLARLCGRGAIDIPKRILETAFRDEWLDSRAPTSLENRILHWVIKDRVLMDMGLVHGEEIIVDLSSLTPITRDNTTSVFAVPPELTNYREIMSVSRVSYLPLNSNRTFGGNSGMNIVPLATDTLGMAASQLGNSVDPMPITGTARCDLVGTNMVRVSDPRRFQRGYILHCHVADDQYLENISPRTYAPFADMCILAVKAYIYNKMIIEMGDYQLQRGQQLGIFKDVIDQWSEASKEYFEYVNNDWVALAHMNNDEAHYRLIQAQIPIGL